MGGGNVIVGGGEGERGEGGQDHLNGITLASPQQIWVAVRECNCEGGGVLLILLATPSFAFTGCPCLRGGKLSYKLCVIE